MERVKSSNRRSFLTRILRLGASLGAGALLLNRDRKVMPAALAGSGSGANLQIDITNYGSDTTELTRSGGFAGTAFKVNNNNGFAVYGLGDSVGVRGEGSRGLEGVSTGGEGVFGWSESSYGVAGYSTQKFAVIGKSNLASSPWSQGVVGITENQTEPSVNRIGVHGLADTGAGVVGDSQSGNGVSGYTNSGFGIRGLSRGTSQGIVGLTENLAPPLLATIGVHGAALTGTGVQGNSSGGIGVLGAATTGISILGWSLDGNGKALVAKGWFPQTANLQEWQDILATPLSVISKDGYLGVGTNSPVTPVHVKSTSSNPAVRLENENNFVGQFIYCYSNTTSHIPFFSGRRARGTTASPTAVQTDDILMRYGGAGYGTSGFPGGNRAILEFKAAQNWTDTNQGTYITFSTTPNNSATAAERMRITDTGEIVPPTDNTGSIGTASKRWSLVRATTVTPGDLVFENGYRLTEDQHSGMLLLNEDKQVIAKFDHSGNLHIKGDLIKDL